MISSQVRQQIEGFDEIVAEEDGDFAGSGLKATSLIRAGRFAVVGSDVLEGSIGRISSERLRRLKTNLADWLAEID